MLAHCLGHSNLQAPQDFNQDTACTDWWQTGKEEKSIEK